MRILILSLVVLISASVSGQRTVDIRIKESGLNQHSKMLKTEIQVRKTDRSQLYLGGYNMRLYYDAEKLELMDNQINSLLSENKYSEINVDNHIRNVNVTGHGDIAYSDNLSFVSFSSNLNNVDTAGDEISDDKEWVSIAALEFKINEAFSNEDVITLARESKTGSYATAFVEMTEWKGPKEITALNVNEYSEDIVGFDVNSDVFLNITVGPNPASSNLNIDFSRELSNDEDFTIILRDIKGVQVINQKVQNGSNYFSLDIKSLASANYIVEVRNNDEIIKTKKIIKIN